MIEGYFSQLFAASSLNSRLSERKSVKQVSEIENLRLIEKVIVEEVKKAVFSMHPNKASRPDGLNLTFFQSFWSVV